jgi:nitrate reductase alpha subunit
VKNNVLVRIEPTYGYAKATDLSGHRASPRWDPPCCQKALVLGRRLYGDRRVKGAFVRKGFRKWVEAGFPRDAETGRAPAELMKRGWDGYERVDYATAYALHAKALENIARTYSGEQGAEYLLAQGYDPAMVAAAAGRFLAGPIGPSDDPARRSTAAAARLTIERSSWWLVFATLP